MHCGACKPYFTFKRLNAGIIEHLTSPQSQFVLQSTIYVNSRTLPVLPHHFQIWPYIQSWLFRCFLLSKQLLEPAISARKSPFLIVFKGQRPLCYFLFFLELFVSMVKHFSIFHFRQKLVFNFSDIFSLDIPKSLLYKAFWPLMQFAVQSRKGLFTKYR